MLVDTLPVEPTSGGQRVYLLNLLEQFEGRPEVDCRLVCSTSNEADFARFQRFARTVLPWPTRHPVIRVITQQVVIPLLAALQRPNLLFVPRDVAPLCAPVPVVTAILSGHLNYLLGLGELGLLRAWYQRVFVRLTILRSRRVIAISRYVAERVSEHFGVDVKKIDVTYLGGGIGERAILSGAGLPRAQPFAGPIILFVGSLFPHKNADRLLEAYAHLHDPPNLVFVGKDVDGLEAKLRQRSVQLGLSKRVEFLGRVSDDALLGLYARASLLVYPSAIEGFGLPLAEAMWLSVPIVASNRTSVPEVAGEAAVIVDPDDVDALADAMARVITSSELRGRLIAAGLQRRELFRWTRTAEETLGAFRRAL